MAQTVTELGQKVKSKYPGTYDDLSDDEVGRKVKAKFPGAYDDFTDTPEPMSASGFARNVVRSGGEFVGNVAQAVTSPLQTAKAIGGLAAGAAEKLIPGQQGQEGNVDALVKMYVDRYGGIENIKKTVYEDPVGFLADVATVAGGVGGAAKLGGLTKVAEAASAVSKVADPVALAGKAMGPLAKTAGKLPEKWYQSALKPSKTLRDSGKLPGIIQAGLENKIPVSAAGGEKLANLIDDLQTKVSATIGAGQGKTINKYDVTSRLSDTAKKFAQQVNPEADLRTISKSGNEFLRNQPTAIPAKEAQALKVGTYRQIRKSYGQLSDAAKESQKALARGLKEELATAFPELNSLNAKESQMLGLDKALNDAVGRISNHQIFGIGTPLAAAGAEAVTGDARLAAVAGAIKLILDNPNLKSRLAYTIKHVQNTRPAFKGSVSASAASRIQDYINRLEPQNLATAP